MPLVAIVMGSKTDADLMRPTVEALNKLGIDYEMSVISAHRNPEKIREFGLSAQERGTPSTP